MRIDQAPTACDAYEAHRASGLGTQQRSMILAFIKNSGGDWSIGEIAHALHMEKSTVSARIWECLNETFDLEESVKRKDRISGRTIRAVRIPSVGQMGLF